MRPRLSDSFLTNNIRHTWVELLLSRVGHKNLCVSTFISLLLTQSCRGKTSCHVVKTLIALQYIHMAQKWTFCLTDSEELSLKPIAIWMCYLGSRYPSSTQTFRYCSPNQHLTGSSWENLCKNDPGKLLSNFWPSEIMWENNCTNNN